MQLPSPELAEITELIVRIETTQNPDLQEINRLQQLAIQMPQGSFPDDLLSQPIRNQLIEKMASGASKAFIQAESERLKQDLGYYASPAPEQLLIDHILTLRLRVLHAEAMYNETVLNKPTTLAMAAYKDKLLTSTQQRYLRAIETLAKIRRLKTPSLQINIAQEGGQQVNVQGEVSGQRVL